MRAFLLFAFLLLSLFTFPVLAQDDDTKLTVDDFAWMTGCWAQERGAGSYFGEQWTKPEGMMIGIGRVVREGKMVEHEFLRLIEKEGDIYYVAIPSGQTETHFKLTSFKDNVATFENPEHDFPQRIAYTRVADDNFTVRVEGERNGKLSGFSLNFKKRPCD